MWEYREAEWDEHQRSLEQTRVDRLREHVTPDPKPAARVKRAQAPKPAELWRELIFARDQGCVAHANPSDCTLPIQFHHCIDQKTLRKLGLIHALWSTRIGICVCYGAHRRHTSAVERIPRECLPDEVISFIEDDLKLGYLLERYHPARFLSGRDPGDESRAA